MKMLSKKDKTAQWLAAHTDIQLVCPHCQAALKVKFPTLKCVNRHTFDANKYGTFFLATKSFQTKYDAKLFAARRYVIRQTNVYQLLHQAIVDIVGATPQVIVDAGCGEGSHLMEMFASSSHTLIGVDLAKAGIQAASDYNGQLFSCVADLANLPIGHQQVDVVLSILSPSNYATFKRILSLNGRIIKVIPNAHYLQEVRSALHQMGILQSDGYSNEDTIAAFVKNYPNATQQVIQEKVPIDATTWQAIIQMTPMTWQLTTTQIEQLCLQVPETITLDVTILVTQ